MHDISSTIPLCFCLLMLKSPRNHLEHSHHNETSGQSINHSNHPTIIYIIYTYTYNIIQYTYTHTIHAIEQSTVAVSPTSVIPPRPAVPLSETNPLASAPEWCARTRFFQRDKGDRTELASKLILTYSSYKYQTLCTPKTHLISDLQILNLNTSKKEESNHRVVQQFESGRIPGLPPHSCQSDK